MLTEAQLWDEFEAYMREQDKKPSTDFPIGRTDKGGNLLILGGHKVNLWRSKNGLFDVAGEKTASEEEAVKLYNLYNSTSIKEDHISTVFAPWYEKQFKVVTEVPSASSNKLYTIRRNPDSKLTCECLGFMFRGNCWHVEVVKEAEQEAH